MLHTIIKALFLVLCLCLGPFMALAETTHVSSLEVAKILEAPQQDMIILDVRTLGEYKAGHLKGAQLVDALTPDFADKLQKLDKDAHYIVHCRTGARSARAVQIMEEMGFKNIVHMNDGIMGWLANDLPIIK